MVQKSVGFFSNQINKLFTVKKIALLCLVLTVVFIFYFLKVCPIVNKVCPIVNEVCPIVNDV